MGLLQVLESTQLDAAQITARTAQIHATLLSKSRYLNAANFTLIHPADLELLFAEYDAAFFDRQIAQALGTTPLHFGLSKRMTSAGGKAARYTDRRTGSRRYEISVSVAILYGCFLADDHRPVVSSGIVCRDRLDALQRVMEHEIVHLIEMVVWNQSSCRQARFHSLTRRFFGHLENTHQMITPRERAKVKFGIQPGRRVRFQFEGREYVGLVNRISKRATVLVEDERGQRYADGKLYRKFYVPAQSLQVVE